MLGQRHIQALRREMRRIGSIVATTPLCAVLALLLVEVSFESCRIEPPLHLADKRPDVIVAMGEVITDIDVIWDIDADWRSQWWYGWDDDDRTLFGDIAYPDPYNFEGRFYYFGESYGDIWQQFSGTTIYEVPFRRQFDFGYYDMLLWSNVVTSEGTQALIVDESDPGNINATTSRSRLSYNLPSRSSEVRNNPEIFYAGSLENLYISRDTADYDYYDPVRQAWVRQIHANLYPLVYIYLVQVVIYNNNGRITGISDNAAVSALADGVHMHSGHTSNNPTIVAYPMRLKHGLPARQGRMADIFGGKLTTFGLCDMDSWVRSRAPAPYRGSRTDLSNHLMLNFTFANSRDSAYAFEITPQLRSQVHGGLVTIEIDADTLPQPSSGPTVPAGGFNPMISPTDSVQHTFPI